MKTQYPYLRKRQSGKTLRIEVMSDSMRVGKTTAVNLIADSLRERGKEITVSFEDWENNPHLKDSYVNPEISFLESQKWFAKRKFEQVSEPITSHVFIQDVAPEMDYCYAETNRRLGRMSDTNFYLYDDFYKSLDWHLAPAPDLLIYLEVGDDELIQRAMNSRRDFESVDPTYFLMMKKVNREWLKQAEKLEEYRILRINTDDLDFAHDLQAKKILIEQVLHQTDLV
jgi:deoxyadenosine/deoxycytidine kinase